MDRSCFALSMLLASLLGISLATSSVRSQSDTKNPSPSEGQKSPAPATQIPYDERPRSSFGSPAGPNALGPNNSLDLQTEDYTLASFNSEEPITSSVGDMATGFLSGHDQIHDWAVYGNHIADIVPNNSLKHKKPAAVSHFQIMDSLSWAYQWNIYRYGNGNGKGYGNTQKRLDKKSRDKEREKEIDDLDAHNYDDLYGVESTYENNRFDFEDGDETTYQAQYDAYSQPHGDEFRTADIEAGGYGYDSTIILKRGVNGQSENGNYDDADFNDYWSDQSRLDQSQANQADASQSSQKKASSRDNDLKKIGSDNDRKYDGYVYDEEYEDYWSLNKGAGKSSPLLSNPVNQALNNSSDGSEKNLVTNNQKKRIEQNLSLEDDQFDCWCDPYETLQEEPSKLVLHQNKQNILILAHAIGRVANVLQSLSRGLESLAGETVAKHDIKNEQASTSR